MGLAGLEMLPAFLVISAAVFQGGDFVKNVLSGSHRVLLRSEMPGRRIEVIFPHCIGFRPLFTREYSFTRFSVRLFPMDRQAATVR